MVECSRKLTFGVGCMVFSIAQCTTPSFGLRRPVRPFSIIKRMPQSEKQPPFALLGKQLRSLRETRRESVAEVSGAVEIDPELLERFERGEECPSEDILTLLISHFDMREQDALQLWEWAGLAGPKGERLSGEQL